MSPKSLSFRYSEPLPMIPLRFISENNESSPIFLGILDSGSNEIALSKSLAKELELILIKRHSSLTAGNKVKAYSSKANVNIGIPGREIKYENIEICILDSDIPILVGICPLFQEYSVTIDDFNKRILLLKTEKQKK